MKLQPAKTEGQNIFTAYGDGYVSINAIRHHVGDSGDPARDHARGERRRLQVDDRRREPEHEGSA